MVAAIRRAPRGSAQDVADFQQGVELLTRAMFATPDSKIKAKWGYLRLSNSADAVWTSTVGSDTLTILRATLLAPSERRALRGSTRFDLTFADGTVKSMVVFDRDVDLVRTAFTPAPAA
jgi:hypothetical protein